MNNLLSTRFRNAAAAGLTGLIGGCAILPSAPAPKFMPSLVFNPVTDSHNRPVDAKGRPVTNLDDAAGEWTVDKTKWMQVNHQVGQVRFCETGNTPAGGTTEICAPQPSETQAGVGALAQLGNAGGNLALGVGGAISATQNQNGGGVAGPTISIDNAQKTSLNNSTDVRTKVNAQGGSAKTGPVNNSNSDEANATAKQSQQQQQKQQQQQSQWQQQHQKQTQCIQQCGCGCDEQGNEIIRNGMTIPPNMTMMPDAASAYRPTGTSMTVAPDLAKTLGLGN